MAKKGTATDYLPLRLLKTITAKVPTIWDEAEGIRANRGKDVPDWPDWCYLPVAAGIALANKHGFPVYYGALISTLAAWRKSKEVYVFDPDFVSLLSDMEDDVEIPTDALLRLPYYAFYVEAPGNSSIVGEFDGFFAALESDPGNHERELRISLIFKEESEPPCVPIIINLDTDTISQSARNLGEEMRKHLPANSIAANDIISKHAELYRTVGAFAVNMILYIIADNNDIAPNSEQAFITHRTPHVRDKYSEIRRWDVGVRVGNTIRAARKATPVQDEPKPTGTHASPRPHMRRAHWHHFWTGPKKDLDARKLVLKWIPPTFVSGEDEEQMPIVLHPINPQK